MKKYVVLSIIPIVLLGIHCSSSSDSDSETSSSAEKVFSSSSSEEQSLEASGTLVGSKLVIPVGGLSKDSKITIVEGESLLTKSVSDELSLSGTQTSASSSVIIKSEVEQDPVKAFTLQIPVSSSTSLVASNVGVVYKIKKYSTGKSYYGNIGTDDITIEDGKAVFEASFFGGYQVVYSTSKLTKSNDVETVTPLIEKSATQTVASGIWEVACAQTDEGVYRIKSWTLSDSEFFYTEKYFHDSSCADPLVHIGAIGTYVVDEEKSGGIYDVTLTITKLEQALWGSRYEDAVDHATSAEGLSCEITSSTSEGAKISCDPSVDGQSVIKTSFKIENNTLYESTSESGYSSDFVTTGAKKT